MCYNVRYCSTSDSSNLSALLKRQVRRFKDSDGVPWAVRAEWRPDVMLALGPDGESVRHDRAWLYFRSPNVTRRLDTFPDDWSELDDVELEKLMRRAIRAPR